MIMTSRDGVAGYDCGAVERDFQVTIVARHSVAGMIMTSRDGVAGYDCGAVERDFQVGRFRQEKPRQEKPLASGVCFSILALAKDNRKAGVM